ncbi:MAG: hypothetical protein K0S33_3397 [Bacteroidetes bacterium]|jgi:hypothetical protein|nr:hypothetical protein [Bacteroidota bacterium]
MEVRAKTQGAQSFNMNPELAVQNFDACFSAIKTKIRQLNYTVFAFSASLREPFP